VLNFDFYVFSQGGTMIIKEIFSKELERPIEGVIKADDEACLRSEVEEYVLTQEIKKQLNDFLEAYNDYKGANGVWISGFFGSGKSHLLKMLALLLENRSVEGIGVLEKFLEKCQDNRFLRGELERASRIPAKSILFNIDQKADVISKTQVDALLGVFVKVFDEMCGYYGRQGHIASFERDLDERGLLSAFKEAYYLKTNRQWEKGREQHILESGNIAAAYAAVSGESPEQSTNILNKYRQDYKVSIEDFAERVNNYIKTKPAGFRLNFFVDEVGQYIANNTKLMTNLQTIAESLATRCSGRAWIIVTAQEDMDNIVGEMTKQHGDDFSKIQDRFKNRIKLTSNNVDEVIQKRLLDKNVTGKNELTAIYAQESNNFRTLFGFAEGTQNYGSFRDEGHFVDCYPFLPYQFALFQAAIQGLSVHNAFEGQHSSVGERSMLRVFQQVAQQLAEKNIGYLASFDLMFDGIRGSLRSNTQRAILQTEAQREEDFVIGVLKALFLVKYVKGFKASVQNLCVLMLKCFDCNIRELTDKVEKTLQFLESQTMIQRNGNFYEYLTDQERDIEKEIKEISLESTDISDELDRIIFDDLLKIKKIRYENNAKCDYAFFRKIDGVKKGKEQDLGIHIISPFYEKSEKESEIKSQSANNQKELFVYLPLENDLFKILSLYKKTEKYILQNNVQSQQDAIRRILEFKATQNRERQDELKNLLKRLIGEAVFFVKGRQLDMGKTSSDAQFCLSKAFQELITVNFPFLKMVDNLNYEEKDIGSCLKEKAFVDGSRPLLEAEQEIKKFLQKQKNEARRVSIKRLLNEFEHSEYGWPYYTVICLIARLCARNVIELQSDSSVLREDKDLEDILRKSPQHDNIIVVLQADFTPAQVRSFKEFYQEFFDQADGDSDVRALTVKVNQALKYLKEDLLDMEKKIACYPFNGVLEPVFAKIKNFVNRFDSAMLITLVNDKQELLELKKDILEPLKTFMNGPQKKIFDDASEFLKEQKPNFSYIEATEKAEIEEILQDYDCFRNGKMQQVKKMTADLSQKVADKVAEEFSEANKKLAALQTDLCQRPEFSSIKEEERTKIIRKFNGFMEDLKEEHLIAVIREKLRDFEENKYNELLTEVTLLAQKGIMEQRLPVVSPASGMSVVKPVSPVADHERPMVDPAPPVIDPVPTNPPKSPISYVNIAKLRVRQNKRFLENESDVDDYLKSLRELIMAEIEKGNKITT
jgi:energy-coupling factor transporter ATP-binding protein EcfA2